MQTAAVGCVPLHPYIEILPHRSVTTTRHVTEDTIKFNYLFTYIRIINKKNKHQYRIKNKNTLSIPPSGLEVRIFGITVASWLVIITLGL